MLVDLMSLFFILHCKKHVHIQTDNDRTLHILSLFVVFGMLKDNSLQTYIQACN